MTEDQYKVGAGKKLRRQFYEAGERDAGKRRWTIPAQFLSYCPRAYKHWTKKNDPGFVQVTPAYARAIAAQLESDGQQHPEQAWLNEPVAFVDWLGRKENTIA